MLERVLATAERRPVFTVVVFALLSSAVRLYLAHKYYGFQTGDDLEVAEEAFRRAVGLVHPPWNVRSLFIPDVLVAPVVAAAHAAGVRDLLLLASIARYPFIILSAVNILLVYALGRCWYGQTAAVTASALYAAHWMPLVYGSSLYPRTVAVTCILSAALVLSVRMTIPRAVLAGGFAAMALTTRYSEAIFFFSLIIAFPWRRRQLATFVASFASGICLFVGLYDRWTWGDWFGSLVRFATLVFVQQDASSVVVRQPPWWYVANLLHWVPATLLPLLVIAVRQSERRRGLAWVAVPLLALSAIFHKELRYLQVVVPFVLLIAACGFTYLRQKRPRLALSLVLIAALLGVGRVGVAERRSTNAVTAALWMRQHGLAHVALSQPWAYGGRLFLGNQVRITDIKIPPEPDVIRHAAPAAVALFSADADDRVRAACADVGLIETRTFSTRGGRSVTVFTPAGRQR